MSEFSVASYMWEEKLVEDKKCLMSGSQDYLFQKGCGSYNNYYPQNVLLFLEDSIDKLNAYAAHRFSKLFSSITEGCRK